MGKVAVGSDFAVGMAGGAQTRRTQTFGVRRHRASAKRVAGNGRIGMATVGLKLEKREEKWWRRVTRAENDNKKQSRGLTPVRKDSEEKLTARGRVPV